MKIGIDLDEVLADSLKATIIFHNRRYNTELKREHFTSSKYWEVWGGTRQEAIDKIAAFHQTEDFFNVAPVRDSEEAITKLKAAGHELHVVTSRLDDVAQPTLEWIERFFPQVFTAVHFTNTYANSSVSRKKSEVCKDQDIELLIEDDLIYATDCAQAGIKVLLFDNPWNQGTTSDNIKRVSGWSEVIV